MRNARLPLRVLVGTGPRSESQASLALWSELQQALASASSRGQLIEASRSAHHVQQDQPELVVGAIRDVLDEIASTLPP